MVTFYYFIITIRYGTASRAGAPNITQQLAASRHRSFLLKELHRTRDRSLRAALHEQLADASRLIGLSVPELDTIGSAEPDVSVQLAPFWETFDFLDSKGETYNLSNKPHLYLALRLDDVQQRLNKRGGPKICPASLRKLLKHSTSPRCLGHGRNIYSAIRDSAIRDRFIFRPHTRKSIDINS
ncbi:hypothetical protein ACX64O_26040 [Pseudomonas fitomaticsae]